jgi:hypothetical protein
MPQTLDDGDIDKESTFLAEESTMSTATMERTKGLSDAQVKLMNNLIAERDHGLSADILTVSIEYATADWKAGRRFIDMLMTKPKKATARATAPAAADLEPGMYRTEQGIFRVKTSEAGHLYAKQLVLVPVYDDATGEQKIGENGKPMTKGRFDYLAGAIRTLSAANRMTVEEAIEFGVAESVCCQCGKTLTDPKSVTAGIGPVCAKRI